MTPPRQAPLHTWGRAQPASTYFQWDNFVKETRNHPLWNEPISPRNSPYLCSLFANISKSLIAQFRVVFHGNPYGPLSHSLTARRKREWFQSLSPPQKGWFQELIKHRKEEIINNPWPDDGARKPELTSLSISRATDLAAPEMFGRHAQLQPNSPAIMLFEALEAVETKFNSYIPSQYGDGPGTQISLLRHWSAPDLGSRSSFIRGYPTGNGSLYIPSVHCVVLVNRFLQLLQLWWRLRAFALSEQRSK